MTVLVVRSAACYGFLEAGWMLQATDECLPTFFSKVIDKENKFFTYNFIIPLGFALFLANPTGFN